MKFLRSTDSPSSLATYKDCARRYLSEYHLTPPDQRGGVVSVESAAGTAAHHALELYAHGVMNEGWKGAGTEEAACILAHDKLERLFQQNIVVAPKPERTQQWSYDLAERATLNGLAYMAGLREEGWKCEGTEVPLRYRMTDDWTIAGTADLLLSKGEITRVADWKTGRYPNPRWQDKVVAQLSSYMLASGATSAEAVYIGETLVKTVEVTDLGGLAGHKRRLMETRAGLEEEEAWQASPGVLCGWCRFSSTVTAPRGKDGDLVVCPEGARYVTGGA